MSDADDIPAYGLDLAGVDALPPVPFALGAEVDAEWAWGGATGAGVTVAIVDSGIDPEHPLVGGGVSRSVVPLPVKDGPPRIADDDQGDVGGHGTACAGIVRRVAPECELWAVRVLGSDIGGTGADLLAGLRWAVEQGADVINLSLSTRRRRFLEDLCEIADDAAFRGTVVVASAHNLPVQSWPWQLSSVVSVAGHPGTDPFDVYANTDRPPVEFFAPGVDLEVAWLDGETIVASGNSFATPAVAGLIARMRSKHPGLSPAAVRAVLARAARNAKAPA